MKEVRVSLKERSYPIWVGRNVLNQLGRVLRGYDLTPKVMIITNPVVNAHYGRMVREILEKSDLLVALTVVPDGEEYKSLKWASKLYDKLLDHKLDRYSIIVALGGGVIGDLAGFVAATFMRGIPYVQVPTTLLAQVDSSVGGKVAVNHPKAKNMIGAFWQPKFVLVDLEVLRTLPGRELRAGLAEVVKYGVIRDRDLFEFIEENIDGIRALDLGGVEEVVARSCGIKAEVVTQDEREEGLRAILNYGHTIGHAIEALTDYKVYRHGEAISVGMVCSAKISCKMGILDDSQARRQLELLRKVGLPTCMKGLKPKNVLEALSRDKKVRAGKVRFVLAENIGQVVIRDDVPLEIIEEVIEEQTSDKRGVLPA